ncbi:hypothetical protein K227x_05950 [Rubripirellula lacrimiformis]|uniref:Uncharacterized protein n=1 Tax=Rubripirellula lacrimiformis TaxID=1930273 RepID=A0A517N517_9BACT|nr:methyltransferase [Rubripirellula lacrimiformis]QDT02222.1 hypothetical protein K227x_05950 [Rubripirellula lacrimiformis]
MSTDTWVDERIAGYRMTHDRPYCDSPTDHRGKTAVSPWVRLCREFIRCHRRPINVALHAVTTPLALLGLCCLANLVNPLLMLGAVVGYLGILATLVPRWVWLATAIVLSLIGIASLSLPVGWIPSVAMFAAGYTAQEAAHWMAGEPTLQSTYIGQRGNITRLVEHTILLLPLILMACSRTRQSPLRLLVSRSAVLPTKLSDCGSRADLHSICDWVRREHPTLRQSTHWWQHELGDDAGAAYDRLSHHDSLLSMIGRFHGSGYTVRPVLGMNELYVTGPPKTASSDTVFYMPHVDGPWAVFPGVRLYRCMLAASPNTEVTTHFPMLGPDYRQPVSYQMQTGDAVAFDFNRELHYITRQPAPQQTQPRINLKLHFVAYPKQLPWYGRWLDSLTTHYDIRARQLFLQTINPNSGWQKMKACWVLGWTKIFEWIARFAGWTNLAYVATLAIASLVAQNTWIFVIGCSFVHYWIYAATFRHRQSIAFGEFARNAVFFKTIAMSILAVIYARYALETPVSIPVVVGGFTLATYSTWVLGFRRSYFSAELGFDAPRAISRFPYGTLPHPMILGAMAGLAGMLLCPTLRETAGFLVLGHLAAYTAILLQESLTASTKSQFDRTIAPQASPPAAK